MGYDVCDATRRSEIGPWDMTQHGVHHGDTLYANVIRGCLYHV